MIKVSNCIVTALHVKPPTAQGLIGAIESKYKISGNSIRFLFKQNREGHKVKIDDDMITYYSNEAAFLMQVCKTKIFIKRSIMRLTRPINCLKATQPVESLVTTLWLLTSWLGPGILLLNFKLQVLIQVDYFQNHPQDFFSLLFFNFHLFILNMKPLSEVVPGLLDVQIQIQAVCCVSNSLAIDSF